MSRAQLIEKKCCCGGVCCRRGRGCTGNNDNEVAFFGGIIAVGVDLSPAGLPSSASIGNLLPFGSLGSTRDYSVGWTSFTLDACKHRSLWSRFREGDAGPNVDLWGRLTAWYDNDNRWHVELELATSASSADVFVTIAAAAPESISQQRGTRATEPQAESTPTFTAYIAEDVVNATAAGVQVDNGTFCCRNVYDETAEYGIFGGSPAGCIRWAFGDAAGFGVYHDPNGKTCCFPRYMRITDYCSGVVLPNDFADWLEWKRAGEPVRVVTASGGFALVDTFANDADLQRAWADGGPQNSVNVAALHPALCDVPATGRVVVEYVPNEDPGWFCLGVVDACRLTDAETGASIPFTYNIPFVEGAPATVASAATLWSGDGTAGSPTWDGSFTLDGAVPVAYVAGTGGALKNVILQLVVECYQDEEEVWHQRSVWLLSITATLSGVDELLWQGTAPFDLDNPASTPPQATYTFEPSDEVGATPPHNGPATITIL